MTVEKSTRIVWLFLLFLAGGIYALAQTPAPRTVPPLLQSNVKSGNDIGFRVDRVDGNRVIGKLVVRVEGKWVEAQFPAGIVPLGAKD